MATTKDAFWPRVRKRAWTETKELLFEKRDRIVVTVLLFLIYLALVWGFIGKDAATDEILLGSAASVAPILTLPIVFAWKLFRVPQSIYQKMQSDIATLKHELEGRGQIELALIQAHDETLFRVTNMGPQVSIDAHIDYSQADLGEVFHVHVEATWLDGYASSHRVLSEGEHNTFLIRKIIENEGQSIEHCYGSIGMGNKKWTGRSWYEVSTPSSELPKTRVTVIITAEPRFPGGHRKIVFDTLGYKLSLISGEADLIQ